jgi:tyrosinase
MSTYVVQQGDTLSGIAQRFGVSLQALEAANPQISDPNLIFPGQLVTIP